MKKTRNFYLKGFTLVEVAVVIFFMGIFVSFAATMLRNISLSTKLRDARDKLATASDNVLALSAKNRTLNFSTFSSNTLNPPRDYWNKFYKFRPYDTTSTVDICLRTSTTLAVCPGGDCTKQIVKDVAYVLYSGGDNLVVNMPADVTNGLCTDLKCMPLSEISSTFDDIYKYVTLLDLKRAAGCVESDSRLRIITNDLPSANVWSNIFNTNSFNIEAAGGIPYDINKYKWKKPKDLPVGLTFPVFGILTSIITERLQIIGTPTKAGTYNFTIKALDNNVPSVSTSKSFVMTIFSSSR